MTTLVLVAVPTALLAAVLLLGFVGCEFTHGHAYVPFEDKVMSFASVVAFWHLSDPSGPNAIDATSNHHDGTYVNAPLAANPAVQSAAAPGTLNFGQPSLVSSEPAYGSIDVNGGRVDVPFSAALNAPAFTVIAYVRTGWAASDTAAFRCVAVSAENDGAVFKGWALFANPANHWEAWMGDGSAYHQATSDGPISLGTIDYLAVTYDGTTLTLYVNGEPRGTAAVAFAPSASGPFRIGQATPTLYPFVGQMSDVAYFNEALDHQSVVDIGLTAIGM